MREIFEIWLKTVLGFYLLKLIDFLKFFNLIDREPLQGETASFCHC